MTRCPPAETPTRGPWTPLNCPPLCPGLPASRAFPARPCRRPGHPLRPTRGHCIVHSHAAESFQARKPMNSILIHEEFEASSAWLTRNRYSGLIFETHDRVCLRKDNSEGQATRPPARGSVRLVRFGIGFGLPSPCVSSTYRNRVRYYRSVGISRSMDRSENHQ